MIEGFYTFVDGHLKVTLFGSMEYEINRQVGIPVIDIIGLYCMKYIL